MKKSESITIRVSEEMKKELQKKAQEKRWTLSQTVAIICEEYLKNKGEQ